LHAFIEKQETINTQLAQTMKDLKDTLAKFTSAQFSSASSSGSQHMDQVKSAITLRSGKVIKKPILEP